MFENDYNHSDVNNEPEKNKLNENGNTIETLENRTNDAEKNGGESFGVAYIPDNNNDKKASDNAGNGYTYIPYGAASQPAYSHTAQNASNEVKKKKQKKNHLAAVLSCVVVLCVLLSAAAAFGGTYFANKLVYGNVNTDTSGTGVPGGEVELLQSGVYRQVTTTVVKDGQKMSVAETAAAVKDSVVEIVLSASSRGQSITIGAGSGVIISADGYIVTNHHVVENASKITVRLTDKTEYEAALVGSDEVADIAVIKIKPAEGVKLTVAVLGDSDKLVVGEKVIAIGNPLGELGGTVTDGIVSALDREVLVDGQKMNLLQTNAAINEGNSGGGLFNLYGELVGVVDAKSFGTGIEGLGFVIPINDAKAVIEQLIEYGYVRGRPAIGITVYDCDMYTAWRYFGSSQPGAYIEAADSSTGLNVGDRIISIDENEISSASDISNYINTRSVGDKVKIVVMRSGKTVEVEVTLKEKVPSDTKSATN